MTGCRILAVLTVVLLLLSVSVIAQETGEFINFKADSLRVTAENRVVASGNVQATYQTYMVTSDRAESDPDTNIAAFEGNVVLSSSTGVQVKGESLSLDLRTREWNLMSASSTLSPEAVRGNLLAPVYVNGREVLGTQDNQVSVRQGSLTTCNLTEPHYVLTAREVDVYPERKLVARGVTFYALGRRLFSLPAFSIPLNQLRGRSNLVPQVGQTQAEGMFLKSAYNYMATRQNTGSVKLDLMSRKGFAQGLEHAYTVGKAAGTVSLYHLFDRTLNANSLTGRFSHHQQLGSIAMDLVSDYRSNSYQYAPASTTSSNDVSFKRDQNGASTLLRMGRRVTSGIGTYETLTGTFTHSQKLFGADGDFGLDYGRFGSPFQTSANEQLQSRMEFRRHLEAYDWRLNVSKRFDLTDEEDDTPSSFAALDRLPELVLQSDTERLGRLLPIRFPASFSLSFGSYHEMPQDVDTERLMFETNTRALPFQLGSRWKGNVGAGFRQAFYGNQAAQYVIRGNTDLTRQLGQKSSFNVRYRYQRPRGASAFRFDSIGSYNVLTGRLNIQETAKFRLSLNTGYNFAFHALPWQDLTLKSWYTPSKSVAFSTSTGYDLNRSQWRGLINQLRVRFPSGFNMDLGTRYDIERSTLASARAQLGTPLGKKMKLQALAGYNGFNNRFDYRAFQITRDLHCWEAAIAFVDQSDFYAEKGFRFNLRIKAFPLFEQFGIGQRGQSLMDTSLGDQL